jgi:hypothetical protein
LQWRGFGGSVAPGGPAHEMTPIIHRGSSEPITQDVRALLRDYVDHCALSRNTPTKIAVRLYIAFVTRGFPPLIGRRNTEKVDD